MKNPRLGARLAYPDALQIGGVVHIVRVRHAWTLQHLSSLSSHPLHENCRAMSNIIQDVPGACSIDVVLDLLLLEP